MPGRMTHKGGAETDDQARLRFQIELEFVQCLANPHYLTFLAQRGYLKDNAFINYLKYLLYWKQAEYAKYIKYPICLYFLDLLQYEHFRREIANAQCAKFIDDQMVLLWQYYTRKRTKLLQSACEYSIPNTQVAQHTPNSTSESITAPTSIKNNVTHSQQLNNNVNNNHNRIVID